MSSTTTAPSTSMNNFNEIFMYDQLNYIDHVGIICLLINRICCYDTNSEKQKI